MKELFAAINHVCSSVEAKILITIIAHEDEGLFAPTPEYMLLMTGITQKNHYFANRKKLIEKGYINISPNGALSANREKIIFDYNT